MELSHVSIVNVVLDDGAAVRVKLCDKRCCRDIPVEGGNRWNLGHVRVINAGGVIQVNLVHLDELTLCELRQLRQSSDPDADGFIEVQPYPSWSLDDNHDWRPPTPQPDGAL
tara:strand:+ start:239 stop:574 length:336 start_codon:yes stop_codon:yes gene_type:complete